MTQKLSYSKKYGIPRLFVFLGDSHVVSLADSQYNKSINFKRKLIGNQSFILISLWFKDTLAYNVSKKRYKKSVAIQAHLLSLLRFFGARYYFNFGEIDIRCHLAKSDKHADFLFEYVQNCKKIARVKPDRIYFLTPTPPSDLYENHPRFPRCGELSERVDAYMAFCGNLSTAARLHSCKYIDLSDALLSDSGGLRDDLTDDGCHLNEKGARIVRQIVLENA